VNKRPPNLSAAERRLLDLVPPDGDFIGNTSLIRRSRLGDRYWRVRDGMIAKGLLARGKGRGGSVARVITGGDGRAGHSAKPKHLVQKEFELYEPLRSWVEEIWGKDKEPGDFFEARITATPKGRRKADGKWTRPDLTLVQVNNYEYLAQPILDITTFEVKKFSDAQDIRSVYEAAAHSRWAHYSFLVAEVPDEEFEFPPRFMSELERFHLGLITMWQVKGDWEFEQEVWETQRLNPDPSELNSLLETFFKHNQNRNVYKQALGSRA